jgi:hypothetical protein
MLATLCCQDYDRRGVRDAWIFHLTQPMARADMNDFVVGKYFPIPHRTNKK